ncbi:hypothetical protein PMLGA01_100022000 [Plasmodium malariae]|uniref:Uncharacterized protein n=1 Tax=Plasmodium malariae TaxID=5858 RepID=A0A1C3KDR1_PLAMA|nr:hypothetical protein PMLGA01_100022000 [Plasmodium malariae]
MRKRKLQKQVETTIEIIINRTNEYIANKKFETVVSSKIIETLTTKQCKLAGEEDKSALDSHCKYCEMMKKYGSRALRLTLREVMNLQ